jgi:hypothetical protein
MRNIILALALLYPVATLAQGTAQGAAPGTTPPAESASPPMVGDKPLTQVGTKKMAAKKGEKAKQPSVAQKLQACQEIDDATKERLVCYDEIFAPQPKPKPAAAKAVNDCRFVKEEDERLTCYNGFADKIPKLPQ